MNYIDEIEYATSYDDRAEAKDVISTFDETDEYKYKIVQYEGMFVIKVIDEETGKFLGYYSD